MRCWLLRRHKLHIPRPAASGRSRPFRCASSQNRNRVAGLRFCIFCARRRNVGFSRCAAHTLAVGAKAAHSGDTRLTAANGACCERVQGCKLFKVLPPYPLALASARAIGRRGAPKECRDFALRFSASALKCRAALQAQGLPRLVLAASETCAARLPSAWSLSAPALCRSGCCQRSHRRSPSTESHAPDEVQMQWLRPPVQGCSCPARQCGAYRRFSAARRSKRFWPKSIEPRPR